jgi:hypothetical protein
MAAPLSKIKTNPQNKAFLSMLIESETLFDDSLIHTNSLIYSNMKGVVELLRSQNLQQQKLFTCITNI